LACKSEPLHQQPHPGDCEELLGELTRNRKSDGSASFWRIPACTESKAAHIRVRMEAWQSRWRGSGFILKQHS